MLTGRRLAIGFAAFVAVVATTDDAHAQTPAPELRKASESGFHLTLQGNTRTAGTELRWARLMLGEAPGWGEDDAFMFMRESIFAQFEREWSLYAGTPGVFSTLGTAAGSMFSQGFVLREVERSIIPCRHSLRPWFKRGGLALVWRIEF